MAKKIAGIYAGSNSHSVRAVYTMEKMDHSTLHTVKPESIAVAVNDRDS